MSSELTEGPLPFGFDYEESAATINTFLLEILKRVSAASCSTLSRPRSIDLSSSITSHSYFFAVILENWSPRVHVFLINEKKCFFLPSQRRSELGLVTSNNLLKY